MLPKAKAIAQVRISPVKREMSVAADMTAVDFATDFSAMVCSVLLPVLPLVV